MKAIESAMAVEIGSVFDASVKHVYPQLVLRGEVSRTRVENLGRINRWFYLFDRCVFQAAHQAMTMAARAQPRMKEVSTDVPSRSCRRGR